MKRLLRLLGKIHLFLDTRGPRDGTSEHAGPEQMRKDVEWQRQVNEVARPLRDNSRSHWWHR